MITSLLKICKRCNKTFRYGNFNKSLQGQMTRKYCNECRIRQHQDESREYQRQKRLNKTSS